MDVKDVTFKAGQRQLSAGALNAMVKGIVDLQRKGGVEGGEQAHWLIEAQAEIPSGKTGQVKRCYWDTDTSDFLAQGEAFTAANAGPSSIPLKGRAFLHNTAGVVPVFTYARGGDAEGPGGASSSSSSHSSRSETASGTQSISSASTASASSVEADTGNSFTNADYEYGSLTADGADHDLDMSGQIPAGTKAVSLAVRGTGGSIGGVLSVKCKGNTYGITAAFLDEPNTYDTATGGGVIGVDANRNITYNFPSGSGGSIRLLGYWA